MDYISKFIRFDEFSLLFFLYYFWFVRVRERQRIECGSASCLLVTLNENCLITSVTTSKRSILMAFKFLFLLLFFSSRCHAELGRCTNSTNDDVETVFVSIRMCDCISFVNEYKVYVTFLQPGVYGVIYDDFVDHRKKENEKNSDQTNRPKRCLSLKLFSLLFAIVVSTLVCLGRDCCCNWIPDDGQLPCDVVVFLFMAYPFDQPVRWPNSVCLDTIWFCCWPFHVECHPSDI